MEKTATSILLKPVKARKYIKEGLREMSKYRTWITSLHDGTPVGDQMVAVFICAEEICHHIFKKGMVDFSHTGQTFGDVVEQLSSLTEDDRVQLPELAKDICYVSWFLNPTCIRKTFSANAFLKSLFNAMKNVVAEIADFAPKLIKFTRTLLPENQQKYSQHISFLLNKYLPAHLAFGKEMLKKLGERDPQMSEFLTCGPKISIWIPTFDK
jgi:hypothetical protein